MVVVGIVVGMGLEDVEQILDPDKERNLDCLQLCKEVALDNPDRMCFVVGY